jgi:hypothetical protein
LCTRSLWFDIWGGIHVQGCLHLSLALQKLIIHDHYASLTVSDAVQNETGLSHVFQTTCVPAIKSATWEVTMKHCGRRETKYNSNNFHALTCPKKLE